MSVCVLRSVESIFFFLDMFVVVHVIVDATTAVVYSISHIHRERMRVYHIINEGVFEFGVSTVSSLLLLLCKCSTYMHLQSIVSYVEPRALELYVQPINSSGRYFAFFYHWHDMSLSYSYK